MSPRTCNRTYLAQQARRTRWRRERPRHAAAHARPRAAVPARACMHRPVAWASLVTPASPCSTPVQVAPPGSLAKLRDARPLPPGAFPDAAAMFAREGATYRWLYTMGQNSWRYTPCSAEPDARLALPPGWREVGRVNVSQGAAPPLPFVYVLSNEAANQLLLLVRPTASSFDWSQNASINQVGAGGGQSTCGATAVDSRRRQQGRVRRGSPRCARLSGARALQAKLANRAPPPACATNAHFPGLFPSCFADV